MSKEQATWPYRSWARSGSPAFTVVVYSVSFLYTDLSSVRGATLALYLFTMALVAMGVHLVLAAAGFLSSLLVVRATLRSQPAPESPAVRATPLKAQPLARTNSVSERLLEGSAATADREGLAAVGYGACAGSVKTACGEA